jgi:transposase-like protein
MVSTMKMVDTKKSSLKTGSTLAVRVNRTGRRTYTAEYKSAVVRECSSPGVSVAGVALAHGINANLLRRWIVRQKRELAATMAQSQTVLLPVSVQRVSAAQIASDDDVASTSTKPRRSGTAAIEIELYGARIHLRGGVDTEALRAVVDVLSRR